jgi:DNA-binding MarR family transcriptional regulator
MNDKVTEVEQRMLDVLPRLTQAGAGQTPPEKLGLSRAQVALLGSVVQAPGCSLQELADRLALSPPTVSVSIRRLEEAGLVTRCPNPEDKRAWQFHLTDAGDALWERIRGYRQERVRRLLAALAPHEQATLVALLEKALHTNGTQPK